MARTSSRYPTELELEILKILWRDGPAPVRHVRDELSESRDSAYTSVMTIMNIMVTKGYLRRAKRGRGFIYTATIEKSATSQRMLGDLVERLFNGSAATAMVNLLEVRDLDEDELSELRQLLDRKMEGQG